MQIYMIQQHVLDAIVATMDQRNVSQGELAASLGCSQTTVSRMLRGLTQLTVDDLYKIARVLQVNPLNLMEQAVAKGPQIVTIPRQVQDLFCCDVVGFHLFNRLKTPMSFADLSLHFAPEQIAPLRKKIADLKQLGAVVEDIDGKVRLNYPDAESLYLVQDNTYNLRITELYGKLRDSKGDLSRLSEKELETWKRVNGDAVIVDYFTKSQVEEQKALLLQFFNFIRSQLRANRTSPPRPENIELRAIYLSSLPYPSLKGARATTSAAVPNPLRSSPQPNA